MDGKLNPKVRVSLNLKDKTNNCDQNQNPQTTATKELGLKKLLWNVKTNGAVQHTYLTCTASKSLRKEVKENNSCLMGPETRQSHTSQQNSQWELAGQCERRNWLGNVSEETDAGRSTLSRPWQNSPQQSTRRSTNTRTHSVKRLSGTDTNLSRAQNTEGKGQRTQIKEKGDKGEISEQGSSFPGMSYWTDGSSEELSWHLLKTNWCWMWWSSTVCLSWSNFPHYLIYCNCVENFENGKCDLSLQGARRLGDLLISRFHIHS